MLRIVHFIDIVKRGLGGSPFMDSALKPVWRKGRKAVGESRFYVTTHGLVTLGFRIPRFGKLLQVVEAFAVSSSCR